MHPIFITIGNIDLEVCSKGTLWAWRCAAYMLIVKFCVHPDYQSILQARLWHKCMDLICANLKAAAAEGCFMPDPFRFIHYVFTPLVAHICNLPEATMIAAVAKNASPLTMATQEQFGDGILHLPRSGKHTLELARRYCQDSWSLGPWQVPESGQSSQSVWSPHALLAWLDICMPVHLPCQ